MRKGIITPVLVLAIILLCCCDSNGGEHRNSAYYWSTVFTVDSSQQVFLQRNNIQRIYLRYFDVVMNGKEAKPNATIRVEAAVPQRVEIVPVVYIMNDCMRRQQPQLDSLLLERILKITDTHDLGPIKEVQIDCDWTKQTQTEYFNMLGRLRERAKAKGIALSATIRLHQLSMAVPPVDRGVLMVYNTGDITKRDGTNAILDMTDVKPYLRALKSYDLPLASAYPVYAWQVAFRGEKYIGIIHSDSYLPLLPGDTVVKVEPSLDMVLKAKNAIDDIRRSANDEVILYEMSKQNVKRIKEYGYEKVFWYTCDYAGTDKH